MLVIIPETENKQYINFETIYIQNKQIKNYLQFLLCSACFIYCVQYSYSVTDYLHVDINEDISYKRAILSDLLRNIIEYFNLRKKFFYCGIQELTENNISM